MTMKSMLMGVLALGCACAFGGEAVVAQKLQTCDFLLNKDFKKNAKYYLCLFSASWCGPCRREMPRLAKTYVDTLKADPDIEFIHFSRDQNDEKALAWAKEHDIKFPVVKPKGGNPLDLHSRGIPHLFIVNADGKLLAEGHPASLFTDEKLRALKAGEVTVPETATDKARKAIAKLFPGWTLETEVLQHDPAGFHANHRGQDNVVLVHPKTMETPAVISRTLTLSDKNPCLFLKVASWNENADYLLSVRVNGKDALPTRLITTPDFAPWEDIVVPLSAWRGSEAKIEVVLTANNWWYENPMLARLEIAEGKGDMSIVEGRVTVEGYKWAYRAQNGEAAIIAETDGQFSCAVTPCPIGDISIPATLGGAKVTRIGRGAFKDCSGLTSVTIPEGVTNVGRDAFRDCTGLQSAKIPSSVKVIEWDAFGGCNALKSLTLPAGLTNIERGAFHWCCGPTSVTIPEGLSHIGQDAFAWCRALTSVTIPSKVTDVAWGTFRGCNALTSVMIPASVTNINFTAFCDTGALTSFRVDEGNPFYKSENGLLLTKDGATLVRGINGDVKIPSGVTTIGPCAFEGSVALRPVVIPSGVKSIGDYAFKQCRGMSSVTIPPSVTSIGLQAFNNCKGLKSIVIPKGVTVIRNSTFTGSGLTEVTIPSGVKTLERGAFSWCGDLKSVTFPEGLTSIGRDAFYNCGKLTSVTIPSSVTRIEQGAFHGCGSLTSVTIPATLTNNIDRTAFDGCSNLKLVNVVKDGKTELMSFDEFCKQWKQVRPGLLGGSLRARRLERQQQVQTTAAKQQSGRSATEAQRQAQADAEKAQREAERAEKRQQLRAIQEELKRVREAKAAASTKGVYCVIDISGGANAERYPISYLDKVPEGGWSDEYKKTKIVLRRIDAGTWPMIGDRRVTFTKPFYIGIFELTQKQVKLISGMPDRKFVFDGDMRPADCLSWEEMRGKDEEFDYPKTKEVAPDSIIGKLRAKTGLVRIDLQTSYQFGCAWNAGTDGKGRDARLTGRHFSNQRDGKGGYNSRHTVVGSYPPNEWGIYDLHGNVWEVCLDRLGLRSLETDPEGPVGGERRRNLLGGCWNSNDGFVFAQDCVPNTKDMVNDSGKCGFRIVINEALAKPRSPGEARTPPLRRCGVSPHLDGGFASSSNVMPDEKNGGMSTNNASTVLTGPYGNGVEKALSANHPKRSASAVNSRRPGDSVTGKVSVAQKLQECDFLLNKDFKKSAKYYLCLFSASWCGPCRAEMPRIAKTYAETLKADPDIEFIHFSRDQDDEKALAWAKEHDVKFPVVKPKGGNPLDLHSRGIPHLFIVKADGTLVEEGHPAKLFTEEKLRALK